MIENPPVRINFTMKKIRRKTIQYHLSVLQSGKAYVNQGREKWGRKRGAIHQRMTPDEIFWEGRECWRRMISLVHTDRGGDLKTAQRVNEAWTAIKRILKFH